MDFEKSMLLNTFMCATVTRIQILTQTLIQIQILTLTQIQILTLTQIRILTQVFRTTARYLPMYW